jgi:hypothetical protein
MMLAAMPLMEKEEGGCWGVVEVVVTVVAARIVLGALQKDIRCL